MLMSVKIIPNARQSEVVGWEGKTLKVRIAAPATEGKANKELVRFVAKICDCAPSEVEIMKGQTAKMKLLDVPVLPIL